MQQVDTLIAARWVVPVEPAGRVLEHHTVAIRQGRIVAVVPNAEAGEQFTALERIERPGHVLLPGLVNAHTHAAMTLLRGAAESSSLQHWLVSRSAMASSVPSRTYSASIQRFSSGTTCFADMHLFPEVVAQTAAAAGIRACIGLPVVEGATIWADSADEYLEKGLALHDDYRDDPLIATALAPYTPWAVSDETLLRVQRTADELELPVTMHVNESRTGMERHGERTLARLERLGLLSPLLSAVHMVHVDDSDLDRAARGGISIVHCPQSNLKLGNGVCPTPAIHARGINLALGTDGAASNNDLSLLDEMRSAALLARGVAHDSVVLSPVVDAPLGAHDWLRTATLNAARALGLGDSIGSLLPGKWADLCCIDLGRAHTQPVYDPVAQLLYAVSRDQVCDVWVAGRRLLADRRLTRLDLDDVLQRAQRWQARISSP